MLPNGRPRLRGQNTNPVIPYSRGTARLRHDLPFPATWRLQYETTSTNMPNTPPNPITEAGPAVYLPLEDEDWAEDQEYVDPYWNSTYDDMAEWLEPSQQTLSAVPDVSPVQSTAFDYSVYGEPEFFQYWHHTLTNPFPHPYPSHLRPSIQTGYRQPLFGEASHQNPLNSYATFEESDWGLEALAENILHDHMSEEDMQTQLLPSQDMSEQFIAPQEMFTQFMSSDDIWTKHTPEPDWPEIPQQEMPAQVPTLNPEAKPFNPVSTQPISGSLWSNLETIQEFTPSWAKPTTSSAMGSQATGGAVGGEVGGARPKQYQPKDISQPNPSFALPTAIGSQAMAGQQNQLVQQPVPERDQPMPPERPKVRPIMSLREFNDYFLLPIRLTAHCDQMVLCIARASRLREKTFEDRWHRYGLLRPAHNVEESLFVYLGPILVNYNLNNLNEMLYLFPTTTPIFARLLRPITTDTHPDLTQSEVNAVNEMRTVDFPNQTFDEYMRDMPNRTSDDMTNVTALGRHRDQILTEVHRIVEQLRAAAQQK